MNRQKAVQRVTLVWAILAALAFFFPHFIIEDDRGRILDAGWGFVFTGPFIGAPRAPVMVSGYSVLHDSQHQKGKGWTRQAHPRPDMKRVLTTEGILLILVLATTSIIRRAGKGG